MHESPSDRTGFFVAVFSPSGFFVVSAMMTGKFWGKPMAARKLIAATLGALGLAGCDPLPKPLYTEVTPPPSYRTEPGGTRIDNEGYQLDAEGYRINKSGQRIGMVDVQAKTAGDNSNAVAGYWISSTGAAAPGNVAAPSERPSGGPGSIMNSTLPTPATMPQQAPITPTPGNVAPPPGYK